MIIKTLNNKEITVEQEILIAYAYENNVLNGEWVNDDEMSLVLTQEDNCFKAEFTQEDTVTTFLVEVA